MQDKSARGRIKAARGVWRWRRSTARSLACLDVGHDRGVVSPSDEARREAAGRGEGCWLETSRRIKRGGDEMDNPRAGASIKENASEDRTARRRKEAVVV